MTEFRRVLQPGCVLTQVMVRDKLDALRIISQQLSVFYGKASSEFIYQALLNREQVGPTSIGYGLAIPHFHCPKITQPVACVLQCPAGFDDQAPDRAPVHLVITIVVPEQDASTHLNLLAQIVRKLQHTELRQRCFSATTSQQLYNLLTQDDYQAIHYAA